MWRSPTQRPFEPGHDVVPAVWAGRNRELDDWAHIVRPRRLAGQYERGRALLGEPGIGKSALAAKIAQHATHHGDIVTPPVRIARGADPLALLAASLATTLEAHAPGRATGDRALDLLARVRSIAGIQIDAAPTDRTPHLTLRDTLIDLARHAADNDQVVLVRIDEAQNVTDPDRLSQLLTALADALSHTDIAHDAAGTPHDRYLPLAIYLSGLPEFRDDATAAAGATFMRRFQPFHLRELDDSDLRLSLAPFTSPTGWALDDGRGVAMTADAIDELLALALGDPFLFQLLGAAAWSAAPNEQTITADHVRAGFATDRDEALAHVERLLERVPARERDVLDAMAALPPDRRTLTEIARHLDRAPTQLGSAARRLDQRGLIVRDKPYRFSARTIERFLAGTWPPG